MKTTIKLGYNESFILIHPNGELYKVTAKTDGSFKADPIKFKRIQK